MKPTNDKKQMNIEGNQLNTVIKNWASKKTVEYQENHVKLINNETWEETIEHKEKIIE